MKKLVYTAAALLCWAGAAQAHQAPLPTWEKWAKQFNLATEADYRDENVLICTSPNAYAYHAYLCSGLSKCNYELAKMRKSQAISAGRTPCKICYKP